MGDGTQENPYTREDVLELIEENGGTAEGLDLSGKEFEKGIDLRKLHLGGIILSNASLEEAHLEGTELAGAHVDQSWLADAHLEGADLEGVHLEGAWLLGAHLEGAYLGGAHLERANLQSAHLEQTYFESTEFSYDTRLEDASWGNYIQEEEREGYFHSAQETYQRLKMWYTQHGIYNVAGKFYYREKEAARKSLKLFSENWNHRLALEFLRALFGYGEGWKRILLWIAGFILAFSLIDLAIGTFIPNLGTLTPNTFLQSLYYSAVSFTALGYGSWAPQPTGLIKGLGAFESLVGISTMALLLVTFVRKWTR